MVFLRSYFIYPPKGNSYKQDIEYKNYVMSIESRQTAQGVGDWKGGGGWEEVEEGIEGIMVKGKNILIVS